MIQTPGVHVWLVLMKAYRAMEARATLSLEGCGLGTSDFRVLEALLHKGPLPVNVIGEKVLLTTGAISVAVERLAAKALLIRQPDPQDRRVRRVALTPKGRRLITRIFAQHALALEAATSGLTAADRRTLVELLKKLGQSAQS